MISAAQLSALETAAQSWRGTPFCEGSPVKGAGVSCHHACSEIFFESQLISPRIPIPNGPSHWSAANSHSLIVDWIEQSGLFIQVGLHISEQIRNADHLWQKLPLIRTLIALVHPGDLLGFRVVNAIHHAAVQLSGGRIVHSVMTHGVLVAPCIPFEWERRLEAVWRLKSLA